MVLCVVQLVTLTGHTYRVLYLGLLSLSAARVCLSPLVLMSVDGVVCVYAGTAMSPDGQTIVTGAGDETLRFWNVFPTSKCRRLLLLLLQVW